MHKLLILVLSLAMLDVYYAQSQPFSATQNLTMQPFDPYQWGDNLRWVNFKIRVVLYNGSFFHLGPALLRTYIYPNFINVTVPMPGVIYEGPQFKKETFEFHKYVDPCLLMTHINSDVNFPEAWTNAKDGYFERTAYEWGLREVPFGRSWEDYSACGKEGDQQICYARLGMSTEKNYSRMYLQVIAQNYKGTPLISDALKSITLRLIGSTSCTLGNAPTTNQSSSLTIDFSNSHVASRKILLKDIPPNASFIVTFVPLMGTNTTLSMSLRPPNFKNTYSEPSHFHDLFWMCVLSASISFVLLLSSSIAIIVLKRRQRRIQQREQYENIPDDQSVEDRLAIEEQSSIVS